MKKLLLAIVILFSIISCENQDIEFPDYQYTTAYFPYQFPVRTLVLGEYRYDNTNDRNHKFLISAAMGGVYSNDKDREIEIEVAENLCENVLFPNGDTIRLMPSEYYSLSSEETVTIPKGEFNGGIEVELADAFFEDSLAIGRNYVIPVRMINSSAVDSILQGNPLISDADPRVKAQWETIPKNFTMFAVKYINPYHGHYLHKGVSMVEDNSTGETVDTTVYRDKDLVKCEIWKLNTTKINQVSVSGVVRSSELPEGNFNMLLTFSDDGKCSVSEVPGSGFDITGSGEFLDDAEEWGNEKRNAIYFNYEFSDGGYTYSATDTLVVRDRDVTLETYQPSVY